MASAQPPPARVRVSTLRADVFENELTEEERRGLQPLGRSGSGSGSGDGPGPFGSGANALGPAAGWVHRFVPNPDAVPDPDTGLYGACLFLGMGPTGRVLRKLINEHVAEALPLCPDDAVLVVPVGSAGVLPDTDGDALQSLPSIVLPREIRKDANVDGISDQALAATLRREQFRPASRKNDAPTAQDLVASAPIWHTDEQTGERQLRTDVAFRQRELYDQQVSAEDRARVAYRSKMGILDPIEVGFEPATELLECRQADARDGVAEPTADDIKDAQLIAADLRTRLAATAAALEACEKRIEAAEKTRDNYLRRIQDAHAASADFQRLWVERYVSALLDCGLEIDSAANRSDPANMLYHFHLDGEEEDAVSDAFARMRAEKARSGAGASRRRRQAC